MRFTTLLAAIIGAQTVSAATSDFPPAELVITDIHVIQEEIHHLSFALDSFPQPSRPKGAELHALEEKVSCSIDKVTQDAHAAPPFWSMDAHNVIAALFELKPEFEHLLEEYISKRQFFPPNMLHVACEELKVLKVKVDTMVHELIIKIDEAEREGAEEMFCALEEKFKEAIAAYSV